MARRHDVGSGSYSSPITRRSALKVAGTGLLAGLAGAVGSAGAAPTEVDLGKQGLEDGDDVSPYIDRYWTDDTVVHVPAGDYQYDGSGLDGQRGNCSLVGSADGVRFHRPDGDSQVRPTIQCTHGTMRVENVTVRGQCPPAANRDGSRWRFDALEPDSRVDVVNVNHPDGSADNSDANAFMTYEDHRGTLHFKNCYVAGFGNSSFYTNLGYSSDVRNPVVLENCVVVDANGAVRGGHNGSQYVDCTFVWRNQPPSWASGNSIARGIRWDHGGHDNLVENCHFYFGGDLASAGESLDVADQGANTSGVVRDVYVHTESDGAGGITDASGGSWDFQNVHVSGPGDAPVSADVSVGSNSPDLSNEGVVWMPESRTVRPGKGEQAAPGGATTASDSASSGSTGNQTNASGALTNQTRSS